MAPDPRIRASDTDRDAVVVRLQDAHAEGRLTAEELGERVERALSARTVGELAPLTADLPRELRPARARPGPAPGGRELAPRSSGVVAQRSAGQTAFLVLWTVWGAAVAVNVVIWALVSVGAGLAYFWPAWVAGPAGAALLVAHLATRGGRGR